MTPQEKIKRLLEESIIFTSEQKEAWLKLIPQMNDEELRELHSILIEEVMELKKEGFDIIEDPQLEKELIAVEKIKIEPSNPAHGASIEALKAMASNAPVSNTAGNAFAKELKREVETPELRKPTAEELGSVPKPIVATKPVPPKPSVPVAPVLPKAPVPPMAAKFAPLPKSLQVPHVPAHHEEPVPVGGLRSLLEIRTVDDLKKIRAVNLRQGELNGQIALIKAKIFSIAQANKLLPFYTVSAFEESPLYKTYMQIGSAMIGNPDADRAKAFENATANLGTEKLTLREFESIADLRKQIE